MATTVEPTRAQTSAAPAVSTPWYKNRQRYIIAAAAVLAAMALVAWFIVASGKRKEEFAARSLNQARTAAEAGNLPLASSELQKLISAYKGTDAASEAVITLNQVRMVNGQNELAVVGLREFLNGNPPEQYRTPAYGLLGAALENAKQWEEAGKAYTQACEHGRGGILEGSDTWSTQAGHTGWAASSKRPRERIGRSFRSIPKSSSVTEAQVRLAEITDGKM